MQENIPPHLQISRNVSEDEYLRAIRQGRIVTFTSLALGVGIAAALLLLLGFVKGVIGGALAGVASERLLNHLLKDAHKAKSLRIKMYPELRALRSTQSITPK